MARQGLMLLKDCSKVAETEEIRLLSLGDSLSSLELSATDDEL